jgi:magnesium-transporting ATPase (P-type)
VITGPSLAIINSEESIGYNFAELTQKVDVVLACRVSPNQKADIVQMVRTHLPNKKTMSIGDGANDVNMIL